MHKIGRKRLIEFVGDVSPETVRGLVVKVKELVDADADKWISLLVGSRGGRVGTGFYFYDALQVLKPKLQTLAMGETSSMAIVVFLAGEHRVVSRHTRMLLHEIGFGGFQRDVRYSLTDIRKKLKELEDLQNDYIRLIIRRTGIKKSTLLEMVRSDTILDAKQAVEFGLAHEIV